METAHWTAPKLAWHMAYVSQQHQPSFPYQVKEVVALGRDSHAGYAGRLNRLNYDVANPGDKPMEYFVYFEAEQR